MRASATPELHGRNNDTFYNVIGNEEPSTYTETVTPKKIGDNDGNNRVRWQRPDKTQCWKPQNLDVEFHRPVLLSRFSFDSEAGQKPITFDLYGGNCLDSAKTLLLTHGEESKSRVHGLLATQALI